MNNNKKKNNPNKRSKAKSSTAEATIVLNDQPIYSLHVDFNKDMSIYDQMEVARGIIYTMMKEEFEANKKPGFFKRIWNAIRFWRK